MRETHQPHTIHADHQSQNPLISVVSPWPTSSKSTTWVRDPPCHTWPRHDPHHHLTHAGAHARKYPPPWAKERCDKRKECGLDCYGERERVEVWEETPKREKELRFGIKKKIGIWDYATVHSYIWDSTVADLQIFLDLQFWMLGGFWALMLNHPYISHLAVPMGML